MEVGDDIEIGSDHSEDSAKSSEGEREKTTAECANDSQTANKEASTKKTKVLKWKSNVKANSSTSVKKLEDQMNFEHLKKLEEIFEEADADGGGGLDIDEFRGAMKRTMGSEVDDKELGILFMKVDTNCDGTVDWDEYLSYMLLEYQEKDTMTSLIKEVPFPKKFKELQSYHRDMIVCIDFYQFLTNRHGNKANDKENPSGRFFVMSKEGSLGIYGTDFELTKNVQVCPGKESCVSQWLTDMKTLSNVNMVAISSTERDITFYDVNANKFERQFQVSGFKDPILTMDFWFDYDNLNHCTLVMGDAKGTVIVFKFVEALLKGLFGVYPQKGLLQKISYIDILRQRVSGAYGMVFSNIHTNWVNRIKYFHLAQGLECFISCSSTDHDSMYLGDLSNVTYKRKWPGFEKFGSNKSCYFKVRKGILSLDYSKDWNIIVTGSFDGIVRTWNPYSCKPASVIKGHLTPVQHVIIISTAGQVITVGRDRHIRIVELRDHSTTQVLGPRSFLKLLPRTHMFNAIYYHNKTKALLLGTMQVGMLEGYDDKEKEDKVNVKSHDGAVVKVLYNSLFDQVVTAGHDSIISVWEVSSGVKVIQFYTTKGIELTAMCFDQTGRRLITGSRNGEVKIWNFNNGACLRTLSGVTELEVTGIICLKQKIITAGWNKILKVYIDSKDDVEDECYTWKKVHKDDILELDCYKYSNGMAIVASCSYDGDIIIWSLDTGFVQCRLNREESYSPLSLEGFTMNQKMATPPLANSQAKTANAPGQASGSGRRAAIALVDISSSQTNESLNNGDKNVIENKMSEQKTVKFESNSNQILAPSAGAPTLIKRIQKTKEEQVRHHVDIVTGQANTDYWEADVSVDKLLFLKSRPHEPNTATLLASGAKGWVFAWSVHAQGGLLGQFVGSHLDGDSVFSMATDDANQYLITGDTSGYLKFWDIENYCISKKTNRSKKAGSYLLGHLKFDERKARILSRRRMTKLNTVPPELIFYYRAHIGPISYIEFVSEKSLLLTSCGDGAVRLWNMSGNYLGTFGQSRPWNINVTRGMSGRMPADVKRVASANTLKIFNTGHSSWRLAKNVLNFVALRPNRNNLRQTARGSVAEIEQEKLMKYNALLGRENQITDEEIEKNYLKTVKNLESSKFHVHSLIPFAQLEPANVIPLPELLQDKMQREVIDDRNKLKTVSKLPRYLPPIRRKQISQVNVIGKQGKSAKRNQK